MNGARKMSQTTDTSGNGLEAIILKACFEDYTWPEILAPLVREIGWRSNQSNEKYPLCQINLPLSPRKSLNCWRRYETD